MAATLRLLLVVLGLSTATAAHAEDWRFTVTPYFWAAGIKGDLGPLPGLPTAHVDSSFSDVRDVLQLGVMSFAEAQKGRFSVLGDLTYIDIGASKKTTIREAGYIAAGLDLKIATAAVAAAYRVHQTDSLAVDLYGGARLTRATTNLALTPSGGARLDAEHTETWVNPLVGGRVIATLNPEWSLTGAGDLGGFGVSSDFAWQALATINYRINERFSLSAGYRYYDDDFDQDGFVYDAAQRGPLVGASIRF